MTRNVLFLNLTVFLNKITSSFSFTLKSPTVSNWVYKKCKKCCMNGGMIPPNHFKSVHRATKRGAGESVSGSSGDAELS